MQWIHSENVVGNIKKHRCQDRRPLARQKTKHTDWLSKLKGAQPEIPVQPGAANSISVLCNFKICKMHLHAKNTIAKQHTPATMPPQPARLSATATTQSTSSKHND
jgi:hypothetical protein